ncbi:HAD hydrolase family protein [Agrilactobacillus yilanensis]|uniref:HAD hydrolase family protein n=1 Tax=Agrilactobacillus yilanensis TaxID=2485997 RepID=A0ABW4J7I3_9LACO|nr:HAD hydrolase family protein [Agrilactobacillus yilanensis]
MIKHIFSDMDGTLLNNHGHITSTTVNAIKDTQIPITLVSARAPMEMASTIKALELKDTQIAFNGGLIFKKDGQGWQYISEYSIAPRTAAAIIRNVSSFFPKASTSYYDRSNWYTNRMDEGIKYEQGLTGQKAIVKNQHKYVSAKTRADVERVIKQANYVPNAVAQDLSFGKTHNIGVVLPHASHPYFTQLIRGIAEAAFASNYRITLLPSEYNETLEIKYLEQMRRKLFDGLIFTSHGISLKRLSSLSNLRSHRNL